MLTLSPLPHLPASFPLLPFPCLSLVPTISPPLAGKMRPTIISPLLRGSFRRYASTATAPSAASSAANTASASAKKAGETLQQISAKVGPMASNALAALGKMGGRTGALVKKVEGRWFLFLKFGYVWVAGRVYENRVGLNCNWGLHSFSRDNLRKLDAEICFYG